MPIIKPEKSRNYKKIKFALDTEISDEVDSYCTWADIEDMGTFFKQAASFILQKDREWQLHKKISK